MAGAGATAALAAAEQQREALQHDVDALSQRLHELSAQHAEVSSSTSTRTQPKACLHLFSFCTCHTHTRAHTHTHTQTQHVHACSLFHRQQTKAALADAQEREAGATRELQQLQTLHKVPSFVYVCVCAMLCLHPCHLHLQMPTARCTPAHAHSRVSSFCFSFFFRRLYVPLQPDTAAANATAANGSMRPPSLRSDAAVRSSSPLAVATAHPLATRHLPAARGAAASASASASKALSSTPGSDGVEGEVARLEQQLLDAQVGMRVCFGLRRVLVCVCFALLCFALFCFALFCFVLLCFALLCFVLLCFVLLCFALLCFVYVCVLFWHLGWMVASQFPIARSLARVRILATRVELTPNSRFLSLLTSPPKRTHTHTSNPSPCSAPCCIARSARVRC